MKIICPPTHGTMDIHVRGYETASLRANAVRQLINHGFNYFLGFRDVQSEFALQYGKTENTGSTPFALTLTDCYPRYYYGPRIQCKLCGKRHSFRPGSNGKCPGGLL